MPEAFETIATRQRSETLFEIGGPLDPGKCVTTPSRLAAGFSAVGILGISDQPFTVEVDEACSPDGPFVATQTLTSAVDPVTGLNFVCARVQPCGPHMTLTLCNAGPSPTTVLDLCGTGIPKAGV